jgi:hypothetical protein
MVGFDEGIPNPFQAIGFECLKSLEICSPQFGNSTQTSGLTKHGFSGF